MEVGNMSKRNRYQQMEQYMLGALLAALVMFIIYLCAAGTGTIWLQVIAAIVAIGISGACLYFLYISQELLKPRSLWMSVAAAAIIVCILFSIILQFPSPNPLA